MAIIRYVRSGQAGDSGRSEEKDRYDRVFVEEPAGPDAAHSQLRAMLDAVCEGDVVEADSFSQIARSGRELLSVVNQFSEKGASFFFRDENVNTADPVVRQTLTIFASLLNLTEDGPEAAYRRAADYEAKGDLEAAISLYDSMSGYRDSAQRAAACREEIARQIYERARAREERGAFEEAARYYAALGGYRDSAERIRACEKGEIYRRALEAEQRGAYQAALTLYLSIRDYRDCASRIRACGEGIESQTYDAARASEETGRLQEAAGLYRSLEDYRDARERAAACESAMAYMDALSAEDNGDFDRAIVLYERAGNYRDSRSRALACRQAVYKQLCAAAQGREQAGDYGAALAIYRSLEDCCDVSEQIERCERATVDRQA